MDCSQDDLQVRSLLEGNVLPQPSEFQDLLRSLPAKKGEPDVLYLYKGFWFDHEILEAVIAFQQHFQALDTDIILVTPPKSGTTWLKSLVFAITQRFQHPIDSENHPLLTNNPHGVIPFLEFIYIDEKTPHIPDTPRLFATHVPYNLLPESIKKSKCKIIYLCRNPRDTFVSMWHFYCKIMSEVNPSWEHPSIEESFERFCEGVSLYGPFWEHILQYWRLSNEYPEKVLFLRYEDLMEDIVAHCKKIAHYLSCSFSSEEENEGLINDIAKFCSFENLSNLEVNQQTEKRSVPWVQNGLYFRKGQIGDWKNFITASMAEKLDQFVEQKLQGSGLKLN